MAQNWEDWRREVDSKLTELSTKMTPVEAGVANFNRFRLDVTKKMGFVHGAAWVWSIVLTIVLGILGWGFTQAIPVFRAIMEDYYQHHPAAQIQKYEPSSSNQVYADKGKPQDASLPASYAGGAQ
jgi:hypothetical protein